AHAYAVTKRDTDAALEETAGLTTVLVRPPAILGAGPTSVWNTLRPADFRDHEPARRVVPEKTVAWVHADALVAFIADLAPTRVRSADDDPEAGPLRGRCTAVNVAAPPATMRDYYETVGRAVGVEPVWDEGPAWTGRIVAARAQRWGWTPAVELGDALAE